MKNRKLSALGFLISLLFIVFITGCSSGSEKKNSKPNILWIVADDLGTNLGCYGDPLVHTPNLDNFAGESVLFENCHTVTAVCSPSRSALVTGMYPVSINCQNHRTRPQAKKPLPDGMKVITEYFEAVGYFTFNGSANDRAKPGKQDYNFKTDYDIYDGTDWTQRKEGQPFFGQIQIHYPHRPFVRDKEHPVDESEVKLPAYIPDRWVSRKDWALYLETIQQVDKKVGKVLKRLEKEGLAGNTYVFFVGDQGRPMVRNKQFLYDGGTHTPLMVRYPDGKHAGERRAELVSNIDLAATSLALAGLKIPEYMQGQNFLGDHTPRTELFTMRDRRDETVDRIRAVFDGRYRYIRNFYPDRPYTQYNAYKRNSYPDLILMEVLKKKGELTPAQKPFMSDHRPAEELYDLQNDPYEVNNLAGKKEYAKIQRSLSSKLDKWLKEADLGTYPEDPKEVEFWKKRMAKMDSIWKARRGLPVDVSDEKYLKWWEQHLKNK
jgi:uncharacterized sulfatase